LVRCMLTSVIWVSQYARVYVEVRCSLRSLTGLALVGKEETYAIKLYTNTITVALKDIIYCSL
jgi:hypothetical protein